MSSPEAPSVGPSTPPSYSSGPLTPPSYSSGPSTPPNYSPGSSRNVECSNCKHLCRKISVLKATLDMHMHPEQHIVNSAALLHEVLNEMEKLDLEYNCVDDDLIELSDKTDPNEYLKLFVTQQIADRRGFIARMGPEVNITRNEVGQLNALIAGLEASEDVREVWDTIICLRDEQRKAEVKLADLQYWLTMAEEEIMEKQKQLK
ncbi:hypothetical protein Tco_1157170 [Tanacetum coccineum]